MRGLLIACLVLAGCGTTVQQTPVPEEVDLYDAAAMSYWEERLALDTQHFDCVMDGKPDCPIVEMEEDEHYRQAMLQACWHAPYGPFHPDDCMSSHGEALANCLNCCEGRLFEMRCDAHCANLWQVYTYVNCDFVAMGVE